MADRLTVQEFFEALREQKIRPLVDTPAVRASVDARVRALCASYPIQERWPVLDLECAFQQVLNELPNILDLVREGYTGTINLRGWYDDTYTMDEWFGVSRSNGRSTTRPVSGRPCWGCYRLPRPGHRPGSGRPTKTPPAPRAVHGCAG